MAGAAIGVSHLVQSTRAGASFGYQLILLVLLTNLLKYPFFEFGHRYSVATGQNLLQGYYKMGRHYVLGFFVLNILTAIGTMVGVTYVTAALANHFLNLSLATGWMGLVLLLICALILKLGHYKFLDSFIKWLMLLLFVSTISAFLVALVKIKIVTNPIPTESPFSMMHFTFLMALMGWMPAPIETSVWQSIWVQEKNRQMGRNMSWLTAKIDFYFGYISTALLAVIFLCLGALVMHGKGLEFSESASEYSAQLTSLYTETLGGWTKPIIALAAFSTMFSTAITCLDAYSRSLTESFALLWPCDLNKKKRIHFRFLLWCVVPSSLIMIFLVSNMRSLIDFVTIASFLTAPIFAFMNYRLIFKGHLKKEFLPNRAMKWLSILGLIYLVGFSLVFLLKISS